MSESISTNASEELQRLRRRVAELESVEAELNEARNKYRMFIESSNTHMVAISRAGVILHANKLSANHLSPGANPEEVIGRSISEFYPPEVAKLYSEKIRDICETGEGVTEELLVPEKDGVRWFRCDQQPIFNGQGKAVGVHTIAHDITDQKQAEQALGEQSHLLETVLDSIAEGVIVADASGKIILTNPSAGEIWGLSASDVPPGSEAPPEEWASAYGVYLPDGITIYPAEDLPLARAMRGEEVPETELFVRHAERPEGIWVSATAQALKDDHGEFEGGVIVFRDVSERKKHEEAIQRQGDFLSRLIESSVDGIVAYDCECRYTMWNRSMEILSGVRRSETLGKCAFEVFPFLTEIGEDEYMLAALKGSTVIARDRMFKIPETGKTGFFEGHYSPLNNESGEVVGGLGIIRVITARKEAEEQLRDHREKLAHVSRISTMGEMATGIAHELNQPLAAIANYSFAGEQLASRLNGDGDDVRDIFHRLKEQSYRAGEIVRRLRNFVKKTPSSREGADLNGLVQEVVRLVEPDVMLHGIEFNLQLVDSQPRIWADAIQIQQVLVNLVLNSIDAMKDIENQKRKLTITTSTSSNRQAEVSVCDSGAGLTEEDCEQVFEAFYSTKSHGMGMGLAISRSIVEDHRGRLWLQRNSERGVTFLFSVPLEKIDA